MNYNVPDDYQIHLSKKSTLRTLNGYPKSEVGQSLTESLTQGLLIDSMYWSSELMGSGFHRLLSDCLLEVYFRDIGCLNPHLVEYLDQGLLLLTEIKKTCPNLGNNQELRNHFAEMVAMIAIHPKVTLMDQEETDPRDAEIKSHQIIRILAPFLSSESQIYHQFHKMIVHFYLGHLSQLILVLTWFVKECNYTIAPCKELGSVKIPPTLSTRSLWLIWQFLYRNLPKDKTPGLEHLLVVTIDMFIASCKGGGNPDLGVSILTFVATLARDPEAVKWEVDLSDLLNQPQVIQSVAEINHIYRDLQVSHEQMIGGSPLKKTKPVEKSKKNQNKKNLDKSRFYENPKNQIFVSTINDIDILLQYANSKNPEPIPRYLMDNSEN